MRKVFLSSQEKRTALINAILKAQGFDSQLLQYTIKTELQSNESGKVVIAQHNILGTKVVIKEVPADLYNSKTARSNISEVDA